MPVEHTVRGRVLALSLPADLDIPSRAAAVQLVQELVAAHRPLGVRLHLCHGPASPASLSVLARLRRLCEGLGVPLTITDRPWLPPAAVAGLSSQGGGSS
ncbi:hypothetical protein [Streptomyces showdoensis]|uniref:hypothetical protein n=1 Tax=Streptomyces showdoensis TaxID=68268 RepID=UPI00196A023D|nr:hypothetical protein [Streptomyces showdoensis]